jgi:hypothetical protein
MSNEKTAANGTSKNGTSTVVAPTKVENKKPELSNLMVVAPEAPKKEMTVAQRIDRLQHLNSIRAKYEGLESSLKKIKSFKTSTDKSDDEFYLTNAKGEEFRSANTEVISDVVELIILRVQKQMAETELELVF